MAGGDDELRIHGSLEGDLAEALRRVEDRLQSVEGKLDAAGRAGQEAGSDIAAGADKGKRALDDLGDEAAEAAESLDSVRERAERGAKALRDTAAEAENAGDNLDDTARSAKAAASGLDDVSGDAREAGASLGATAKGAAAAATELGHTAREANKAARALDDAGDEAAESGAKAAASALLWERMAARIDRGERVSRRFAATHNAMRWSTWTSGIGSFFTKAKSITSGIDWDGTAKKVTKVGKAFGGFGKVMTALKIGVVVQGIYILLGLLSALGAGAVGAAGGLLGMMAGLAALGPILLAVKIGMAGIKAALKETQPEVDALKKRFEGFGTSIAAGGLRSGLQYLNGSLGPLSSRVNTLGTEIGKTSKNVLRAAGDYVKSTDFLQRYGVIAGFMPGILGNLGISGLQAGSMLTTGMAAASPAAQRLSWDVLTLTGNLSRQANQLYESGRMTEVINKQYDNLRRAVGVLADWCVGLFRIFRIGAQESKWMGDSIEASAQRFRDWTGTVRGQNAIRDYFVNAMPAVREAGLLIRDLFVGFGKMATNQDLAPLLNQIRTQLLPALLTLMQNLQGHLVPGLVEMATHLATLFSGLDFSGLQVLIDGINAFLRALLWAQQNVPGFNLILSTLLTTMFLLGPVATVAGKVFGVFSKLGSAFGWISKAKAGGEELSRMQKIMGPLFRGIGTAASFFSGVIKTALTSVIGWFTRLGGVMGILRWIGSGFMMLVGIIGWPVTLIIAAVVAIVAIFIYLWNNCEWFRNGVINILTGIGNFFVTLWRDYVWPALQAIGSFFVWLWTTILQPVLSAIWTGLRILGAILFVVLVGPFLIAWNFISAIVMLAWEYVIRPVLEALGAMFVWIFQNVIMGAVNFFVWLWNFSCAMVLVAYYMFILPALNMVGAIFVWIFNTIIMPAVNFFVWLWNMACAWVLIAYYMFIAPALNMVGAIFSWVFNTVIMPVINFFVWLWNMACLGIQLAYYMYIVPAMNMLAAIINWLYTTIWLPIVNGITTAWNWMCALLQAAYYMYIQPAFNAVGNGLNVLRGWFDSVVAGIGQAWAGLKRLLAVPVNFMINAVWNNGIVKAWNWAADLLGLAKAQPMAPIPEAATGAIMPGPATPGRDTMLAAVGGREAVMRSEWTDAVGDQRVARWNYLARTGGAAAVREDMLRSWDGPAFAGGGIMAPTQASSSSMDPAGSGSFGSMGDWARSAIAEITDPLINLLPGGPPAWLDTVRAFPRKVRDSVVDWAVKKFEEMMAAFGGGGGGGAARWAPAIAMALGMKGQPQSLNPVVQRRMNQESGGNPTIVNMWDSNAKKGTPSVGLMQVIGPTYRANADKRRDVGPYLFGTSVDPLANILASMGYAMRRYGSLAAAYNKAGGYDSGGYLQPGWTSVWNGTGKPEPVFTSGQWGMLESGMGALMGGGGDLVSAMLSTPMSSAALAASGGGRVDVEAEIGALAESVRELAASVAERPPPMTVLGDEVRKAVQAELDAHNRRKRAERKYRYGED